MSLVSECANREMWDSDIYHGSLNVQTQKWGIQTYIMGFR